MQVDMSEIRRQSRQEFLHVSAGSVPFRQPVDGERVPQVMKPGLTRTRVTTANAGEGSQALEGGLYQAVANGLVPPSLEKKPVVLIPSSWCRQVIPEEPNNIPPQRDESGLVELRPADGDHSIIEVHVRKAQANRFSYSRAGSI
ncbi:MAG: hypothetical protein QM757_47080 [Paludibaculum sp.]